MGINFLRKSRLAQTLYAKTVLRHRIFAKYPSGITVELTDRCNLRCSYCPKSLGIGVHGGDMDFVLFKKVIDEANGIIKLKSVALTGFGEPLLYPQLGEAIRYVRVVAPGAKVCISTNGILLSGDKSRMLVDCGVVSLTISVNAASPEKYRELNGADHFWQVVQNARGYMELMGNHGRVFVQILDKVNTKKEIRDFYDLWKSYRAEVQVQPFVNWAGLVGKVPDNKGRYPCAHLQGSWIVTREGDALACCMAFPFDSGRLVLGNVKEMSLDALYSGSMIRRLRKLNCGGALGRISRCKECDAWKTVPNMWFRNPIGGIIGRKWL